MEEERVPMSFVKTVLYSIATACISVYRCLLGSLAARVCFNLFNINQTTAISSGSESLVKQQAQKDKDESLDAEWEEEDGSDEYITSSEATEGRKDLDRGIPSISMEEDGGASYMEAPITVVQLDIWSPQEIPYHVLASATNNFSQEVMLGKGGFGSVYRGFLTDLAMDVAIKKLSERSQQGLSEYMAEVKIITRVRHRNLVKLIGWCHEHGELLLVYEFLPNGSLDDHLFRDSSNSLLDWSVRYKVAVRLANALTYLHDECDPCVLHRDVKSSNVLLDSKSDAKLADFGLARHFSLDDSSVRVSCPAGTRGYWAPEYALRCRASRRSDVYSFGVVALEIACGKKAILVIEGEDGESDARLLVEWVWELHGNGSILDAADKRLNGSFDQLQMERLLMVGLWCAQPDPHKRPSMRQAGNALLFPETTPLPDLPRTAVSWAHAVASMRMQTVQLSSIPVPSPTLSSISEDVKSLNSGYGEKPIAEVKPGRRLFPQFTWWTKWIRTRSGDLLGDDPEFKKPAVELSTLRLATNNFSYRNLLEQDGFSAVYKGVLPDGKLVAVRRLPSHFDDGVLRWRELVVLLLRLQHRNLVRLLGFCIEGKERLLVYEYVSDRSLDKLLFDAAISTTLDWERRYKIIGGIARGLQYLHEDSQVKIIHRDLKAKNVLLDADMNPKISNFDLARLFGVDQTEARTSHVAGTFGYMSPEYIMRGHFSNKSDVFSFGVLVLEIVTGQSISAFVVDADTSTDLLTHVWEHWTSETVLETVDPSLSGRYQICEVLKCVQIGLLCIQEAPSERPTMTSVALMLSSLSVWLQVPQRPAFVVGYSKPNLGVLEKAGEPYSNATDEESTSMSVFYSTNEVSITELEPR